MSSLADISFISSSKTVTAESNFYGIIATRSPSFVLNGSEGWGYFPLWGVINFNRKSYYCFERKLPY